MDGRVILINFVLDSIPTKLLVCVLEKIE